MSIKIEEFFRKISLPKRYINDKFNIREKYREEAAEYLKLLEEIDGSEFEGDKKKEIQQRVKEVKDAVKENIDSINNVFTYHEEANPKAAQEEIDCMMERMKDEIFVASIDDLVGIRVNGTDIYKFENGTGKPMYMMLLTELFLRQHQREACHRQKPLPIHTAMSAQLQVKHRRAT